MIFDKPDLSLREGETAARPTPAYTGEASWLNAAIANHDDILTSWNHIAGQNASEEAYDAYIDRVKAATGEQMENPWRTTGLPVVVPGKVHSFGLPSFTIASTGALKENAYAAFDTRRKELAAKYPEHASLIAANRPMSDFSRELVLQNRERSDAENAKLGGWAWTAQLAGGLVAGLQDPVNLATMGFGFGAGTGAREIILAGVKAGAINAATEVGSYSAIKDWRERAGLEYSTSELAMGAASAFLLGFGVDAGGRALWRAGRGRLGYEPVIDKGGIVTGYRKPEQSLDDAVKDLPADHVVRRAYDGDNQALREVAEQTGAINNPAVKGALDFEMLNDLRPSKVDGVEPWEFESRSLQALRSATDPDEPPPVRLASIKETPEPDGSSLRAEAMRVPSVLAETARILAPDAFNGTHPYERADEVADALRASFPNILITVTRSGSEAGASAYIGTPVGRLRLSDHFAHQKPDIAADISRSKSPREVVGMVADAMDRTIAKLLSAKSPIRQKWMSQREWLDEKQRFSNRRPGWMSADEWAAYKERFPVRLASILPQQARELDDLGFYSKALEAARALRQAKGTPEQMRAQLRSAGVKEAELQAVGLDGFLEGKASVTRDEIVSHIETAKVNVREARYGDPLKNITIESSKGPNPVYQIVAQEAEYRGGPMRRRVVASGFASEAEARASATKVVKDAGVPSDSKWSSYSLDPSNPTYRETVLHLPASRSLEEFAADSGLTLTPASRRSIEASYGMDSAKDFRSGHWDEPNVIAHARTSMQKDAQGRNVFVVNELQSDWGQGIRDGAMDEFDLVELEGMLAKFKAVREDLQKPKKDGLELDQVPFGFDRPLRDDAEEIAPRSIAKHFGEDDWGYTNPSDYVELVRNEILRLQAEVDQAKRRASVPKHPLVNTTDQWVDTGLKRMIRQAVDADADQIAIPSGETVKAFGMGGEESGIKYAYDQMYPKNLRNLLRKFDKGAEGKKIDHLFGQDGDKLERSRGFTTFELTPEIKRAVRSEGMTLFSLPRIPDGTPPHVVKLVDELVADPARHEAVIRELADAKPQSVAEARKVVGEYLARGREAETQRTYLGARTNPDDTEPLLSRSGLSEPNGPEAKAMVDALERDLAPQQKPTTSKELPRGRTAYDAAVAEGRYVHTETADARMAEIRAEVARTVAMLPPDVQLRVQENLIDFGYGRTAQGAWDGYDRIVYVSLAAADPVRVARHETVHALRQSGLMSDAEFDTLYRFAESEGLRAAYKIDENYKDLYGKAYGDRGEAFVEALLREETIADMFADYSLNGRRFASEFGPQGRIIDQIMQLIVDFLKAVRDAVGVHGLKDVRDVFEAIESGAMAQRGSKVTLPDGSEIEGFHLFSIRAFHGTPHTFEPEPGAPAGRFKAERIGTGEGAQAYGHGLYFAENEGVARNYRNALSSATTQLDGIDVDAFGKTGPANQAMRYVAKHKGDIDAAIRHLRNYGRDKYRREAAKWLVSNRDRVSSKVNGRLYEVRINAEPEQFLDWDKPLAQQSLAIRQAIERDPAFVAPLSDAPDNFMRNAVRDAATAAALRDAGIVGIRYLDRGSRGSGEGTSNFVIFPGNENLVEIVAVDGKPVVSLAADLADAKRDGTMGKIVEACRL